jgi:hypothetical protein
MIPRGVLVRSRVAPDARAFLESALDRRHTGYAVVEPAEGVLLDADGAAVVTFEAGVPTLAYHAGTDRGGPAALGALGAGPFRVALYEVAAAALAAAHATTAFRVPPGAPAERLAGAPDLADRTRRLAPDDRAGDPAGPPPDDAGAVEAFLADEERIEAIKRDARREAERRAEEWGFADAVGE